MVQERLLDIAVREFAAKGLEGVSTRDLAAAAGTAMSSITYHYGGKEGLYLAAADHIVAAMGDVVAETDAALALVGGEPAPARAAIKAVLGNLVDRLAGRGTESWSLFILREQMNPSEAFERLYAGAMERMFHTLAELVCLATGIADQRAARVVVLTLFGQVVVLRAARETCARLIGDDCADPAFVAEYRERVAANTDAILDAMAVAGQGRA